MSTVFVHPDASAPARAAAPAAPVSSEERVHLLDALRGFALGGILLANIRVFTGVQFSAEPARQLPAAVEQAVSLLTLGLVDGKFYSIFSFLFGLGFAIQLMRARERREGTSRFRRRLRVLLAIGLAHVVFLWPGDIVHFYAVMGFALIPFVGRSDRTLVRWTVGLLAVTIVLSGLMILALPPIEPPADAEPFLPFRVTGPYLAFLWANLTEGLPLRWLDLLFSGRPMRVLAMFLLGYLAGRSRILHDVSLHRPLLVRVLRWGLGVGLVAAAIRMALKPHYSVPSDMGLPFFGEVVVYAFGVPALALGYIAAFALLWESGRLGGFGRALVPVGRMALTNYLLQSVVCVLLFYPMVLGLGPRMGHTANVVAALAIFAAQVPLSAWWLGRFRYGPVEWLWRCLTYRERFPLRREAA